MPTVRTVPAEQLEAVAARGELFALLDSCDEASVPKRCRNGAGAPAKSLYQGKSDEHFWHIAPYLATVSPTELNWILEDSWAVSVERLQLISGGWPARRHSELTPGASPGPGTDGKRYPDRFHDPRAFPEQHLSSSSPKEIEQFYGPVSLFGVTAPDGSHNVDMLRP